MEEGVKMLIKHICNQDSQIYVQVDSDADGYTSAAVLLNYLHQWVPSMVDVKVSYGFHSGKAHGINLGLIPEGTSLVIAPDSSSSDFDIHEELYRKGIDVLVIDHHKAEKISEYACVINNQLCDYPTKSLSGVGMVYKFCQYLDTLINQNLADDYLDLVAVGMVADMMSLKDCETHHLIKEGLQNIRNPFVAELIDANSFVIGDEITPIGIAFGVAPQINAITRVGTEQEKRTLFEAMLEWKAYESIPSTKRGCKGQFEKRVDQAIRNCTNVKNKQTKLRDQSLEAIEILIDKNNLLEHQILLIKLEEISIDRNLSGLIANELSDKYQHPTMILSKYILADEETGVETIMWEGSARGVNGSRLEDLRKLVRDSGLAYLAEGHPNAFGVGFFDNNIEAFLNYSDSILAEIDFSPCYKVDFVYSANELKPKEIIEIGDAKSLWGQDISEPYIIIKNIKITKENLFLMKRGVMKITLPNGVDCIKFKSNEEEYDKLYSDSGCVFITALGRCSTNYFAGRITPQIKIEKYEIENGFKYNF